MLNFVVNATSGRGKGQRVLKKIISYCYENKIEYTVHITSCKGHAERITRALCDNHTHTIVAVGGDGTFHEVLNGITTLKHTALGFIPSGRGNDFARGQGIPLNPIKALERIVSGNKKTMDFIEISGRRCLNTSGIGLDIDVLKRVDGQKGKLTYIKSLIYCMFHFQPYNVEIEHNGQIIKEECLTVGVCNGTQYGGGIKISPLSKADDGLLDVVIIRMPPDKKLLKVLPKFVKGKHIAMPITTHFTCEKIKITPLNSQSIQLDGEIYDDLEFDCAVAAGQLITF